MGQELLTLQNLAKYYTSAQSVVIGLNQTNLTFCRGEFVAVTGESGSGKSTLAHVLGGILPYESGELLYKGKPTSHYDSSDWERYRRDCVSFISQSYGVLPGSSVIDNVTCALRLTGTDKAEAQRRAEEILKKVELWDLRHRRAAKLSSGQKQRLSIARALAKPAPVLIADEPTGNLDAENSAMVISLLSEAAKDRLVILITHEFSEAKDFVTRHIELRDGRVTMDTRLREVPALPEPGPVERHPGKTRGLDWFVARFQIKARPVWSVLMLCLFAATVFSMFAFSGTFVSNLDDTFTYYYDNSGFRNGDPRRVVVGRLDGEEMTEEDTEKLLSTRYVESLEEYGYLTDIQYAYRENEDYVLRHLLENIGSNMDPIFIPAQEYSVIQTQGKMLFARTVPRMSGNREFLTGGRLPENVYEVVAAGGPELLGERITVLVQDQKNWSVSSFLRFDVTVVGVTDYGSHLYFHRDLGRMMLSYAKTGGICMPAEKYLVGEEKILSVSDGRKVFSYTGIEEGTLTGEEGVSNVVYDAVKVAAGKRIADNNKYLEQFAYATNATNLLGDLYMLEDCAQLVGVSPDGVRELRETLDLDVLTAEIEAAMSGEPLPEAFERLKKEVDALREKIPAAGQALLKKLDEMDPAQLTVAEVTALAEQWGIAVHELQPGEAVVPVGYMEKAANNMLEQQGRPFKEQHMDTAAAKPLRAVFSNMADHQSVRELTLIGSRKMEYPWLILLHPEDFNEMIYPGKGEQVSLTVEDYAYVDRVLDDLHAMGYVALSPYQEGAVTQNPELAEQRMQTLRVCLIAFFAVVILQILLLRAMFSMETESYRLLSHIGLNGTTAKRSVLWQILLFALGGQLLGGGLIALCAAGGMDQLVHILRYLPLSYRLVLCLLHLGVSVITAVWTMRALQKQVFPQSEAQADLDWDAIGEEVEA